MSKDLIPLFCLIDFSLLGFLCRDGHSLERLGLLLGLFETVCPLDLPLTSPVRLALGHSQLLGLLHLH